MTDLDDALLRQLLTGAATNEGEPVDLDRIHADGTRRKTLRAVGTGTLIAATVTAAVTLGAATLHRTPGQPTGAPSPTVASTASGSTSPSSSLPGFVMFADSAAVCAQVGPPAGAAAQRLAADADVTGATVCEATRQAVAGDGEWEVRRVAHVSGPALDALVTALRAPNATPAPGGICDAVGTLIPDFWLTLADGTLVRVTLPEEGCHPSAAVTSKLGAALTGGSVTLTLLRQLRIESLVASGCSNELKTENFTDRPGYTAPMPVVPAAGTKLAVCVLHRDPSYAVKGPNGTLHNYVVDLAATGMTTIDDPDMAGLFHSVRAGTAPTACQSTEPSSVVSVQTVPAAGKQPTVLLYAELGSCGRVFTGGFAHAGVADPAAALAVSLLATDAVTSPTGASPTGAFPTP